MISEDGFQMLKKLVWITLLISVPSVLNPNGVLRADEPSAKSLNEDPNKLFDASFLDFRIGMTMSEIMQTAKKNNLFAQYDNQMIYSADLIHSIPDPLRLIEIRPILGGTVYIHFSHATKQAMNIAFRTGNTDVDALRKAAGLKWGQANSYVDRRGETITDKGDTREPAHWGDPNHIGADYLGKPNEGFAVLFVLFDKDAELADKKIQDDLLAAAAPPPPKL